MAASVDRATAGRQSASKSPTMSVTITNYNYPRYLDQNISSIRKQTFDDFELIIIDNASTDDSLEIIGDHASADDRIHAVAHDQNQGMFASLRNRATSAVVPIASTSTPTTSCSATTRSSNRSTCSSGTRRWRSSARR